MSTPEPGARGRAAEGSYPQGRFEIDLTLVKAPDSSPAELRELTFAADPPAPAVANNKTWWPANRPGQSARTSSIVTSVGSVRKFRNPQRQRKPGGALGQGVRAASRRDRGDPLTLIS
ncbi:MAG: hypothetical protein U0361_17385 [Nitrospiraceae bacterium]